MVSLDGMPVPILPNVYCNELEEGYRQEITIDALKVLREVVGGGNQGVTTS